MALNLWPAPVIHSLSKYTMYTYTYILYQCTVHCVQYICISTVELIFERLLLKGCFQNNSVQQTILCRQNN